MSASLVNIFDSDSSAHSECNHCLSRNVNLSICEDCMGVMYCSYACQKQDWPEHALICGNGKRGREYEHQPGPDADHNLQVLKVVFDTMKRTPLFFEGFVQDVTVAQLRAWFLTSPIFSQFMSRNPIFWYTLMRSKFPLYCNYILENITGDAMSPIWEQAAKRELLDSAVVISYTYPYSKFELYTVSVGIEKLFLNQNLDEFMKNVDTNWDTPLSEEAKKPDQASLSLISYNFNDARVFPSHDEQVYLSNWRTDVSTGALFSKYLMSYVRPISTSAKEMEQKLKNLEWKEIKIHVRVFYDQNSSSESESDSE